MVCGCICQSNIAFSNMYHNHIDLEYYLNTVVMAPWFTVLCANGTTTAPSTRWYFQRIFQKLEISSMTLLSRHGVWSVGWGERRMWQRRMWEFCWPVTCVLRWQSTELLYSLSCCIQHTQYSKYNILPKEHHLFTMVPLSNLDNESTYNTHREL